MNYVMSSTELSSWEILFKINKQ